MTEKKNIVILTEAFPDGYVKSVFVLQRVLELAKRNYNITVLYPKALFPSVYKWLEKRKGKKFIVPKKINGLLPDDIKFYFVPFILFTRFGLKDFLKAAGIFTYIKLKRIKVDLIHAHVAYDAGYLGVLLGRWLKKPVVITAHGGDIHSLFIEEQEVYRGFWSSDKIEDVKPKVITTLQECNKIIAVSNELKKRITELGVLEHKVSVIYNGINPQKFHPIAQTEARTKLNLPNNKKTILFIGGLTFRKGILSLIEAMYSLKEERENLLLVIIGNGPLKGEIIERLKSTQLEQDVILAGTIPNDKLPLWYAACDIFCLPSLREGTPCVVIEAMACGRPVVSTSVSGTAEVVNNSEMGILVPPKNAKKLAQALLAALDKKWDTEFIRRASERFHWSNIIPQIETIYTEAQKDYSAKAQWHT